jgi:AraC family transcriptional regulator
MPVSDCYGEAFGRRLNAQAVSFLTRGLPRSTLAVTELRYQNPQFILSTPPVEEEAFIVAVHLELFERYEYWQDGRAARVSTIRPGEVIIYDLRCKPTFHLNSRFHSVHFYLPIRTLHALADEAGAAPIEELHYKPAVSLVDPLLRGMVETLLPLFSRPERTSRLFMDHAMLAVGHHVAYTYGHMRPIQQPILGGLTPWQERRAKEYMSANLARDVPLASVARECGLSASHFRKAFRKSVGMPPHRWLMQQRISLAKSLMRQGQMTLAQIGLACGFCDQSHFTQCFSAWTGFSPGIWRRSTKEPRADRTQRVPVRAGPPDGAGHDALARQAAQDRARRQHWER